MLQPSVDIPQELSFHHGCWDETSVALHAARWHDHDNYYPAIERGLHMHVVFAIILQLSWLHLFLAVPHSHMPKSCVANCCMYRSTLFLAMPHPHIPTCCSYCLMSDFVSSQCIVSSVLNTYKTYGKQGCSQAASVRFNSLVKWECKSQL